MFIYLSPKHRIEVRFPISSKRGTTQQSFLRQSLLALEAEELIARGCWIHGPDLRYHATQPTQRISAYSTYDRVQTLEKTWHLFDEASSITGSKVLRQNACTKTQSSRMCQVFFL